jgi:hypothetical protein
VTGGLELREDLLAGALELRRAVVRVEVGRVVELVGQEPAVLLGQPRRDVAEVRRVRQRRVARDDHLGAELAELDALVDRHPLGQHADAAVAARRREQRQADPGVAGGALDDRRTRPELTLGLGVEHERARGPVLHAASGVQVLALDEHLDRQAGRDSLELDQRRVADGFDHIHAATIAPPRDRAYTPGQSRPSPRR